jgi:hypothetical protein
LADLKSQEENSKMRTLLALLIAMLVSLTSLVVSAQEMKYPPLSAYMMQRDAEIALAKSAGPANISDRATIKVLTENGFEVARQGDNGFVCFVMRGFTGAPTFTPAQIRFMVYDPKTLAPICLDPQAAKMVLPYYELRTNLGIQGKTPDQIAEAVKDAYAKDEIPKRDQVSFGYMWSADQVLGPGGHWHPHIMVFAPNYENPLLGGNELGGHLPVVSDDGGTPFAVVVIPVDDKLAIKSRP